MSVVEKVASLKDVSSNVNRLMMHAGPLRTYLPRRAQHCDQLNRNIRRILFRLFRLGFQSLESELQMNSRTAAKRREILDTASQLFARHGYQGTNMKLLAKEAQASTSTIYSYFRDKTDLLSQCIERRLEALESRHQARLDEIEDPLEALLQGIHLLNKTVSEDPLLSSLMVYDAYVSDLRIRSHVRRVLQRVDKHNVALVRRAMDQGVITFEDPQALVTIFRLSFQGWLLNRQNGESQLSQEELTLTVKRLILELINDD